MVGGKKHETNTKQQGEVVSQKLAVDVSVMYHYISRI
jgi:hypothetical protein